MFLLLKVRSIFMTVHHHLYHHQFYRQLLPCLNVIQAMGHTSCSYCEHVPTRAATHNFTCFSALVHLMRDELYTIVTQGYAYK